MSGPVQPPLTVETIDGTTSGRPITTIKVTNGDLTVSGNIATIDTSGGGGGGMTSFDLAGDSGATQSIGNGDTLSVLGGTGLASVASATDTVTLNISNTLVSGTTPNYYDALTINAQGQVTAVAAGTAPQAAITLTTTGTSGAATLVGATLNIPQYSGGGGGITWPLEADASTKTAPAYSFSGDTDTGIYNPAANEVSITLGDTRLFDFQTDTSSGKFQLRGASPIIECDDASAHLSLRSGGVTYGLVEIGNENDDIKIAPGGTGKVLVGSGAAAGSVSSSGAHDLIIETNSGTDSGAITITDGANGAITVNPDGTGTVGLGNFVFDVDQTVSASEDAYVLTYTDSTGEISLKAAGGGGGSPAGSNKEIQYNNSGSFGASSAFTWDESDKSLIINDDLGGGGISLRVQSETNEVPVAHFQTKTSTTNATSQVLKLGAGLTAGARAAGYGASLAFYVADEGFGGFKSGEIRTVWIDSDSNSDMVLEASGTGNIGLEGVRVIVGSGTNSGIVTSNGAYDLILDTNSGTNSGAITITDGTNGNITVNPNGTGTVGMGNFVFDVDQTVSASEDAYVLTYTDSTGEISLKEAGGGGGSGTEFKAMEASDSKLIVDYDINNIAQTPPWGISNNSAVAVSRDEPIFWPFISPATGTVSEIVVDIDTAASSTCNLIVALYSDDNGAPNAKLGSDAIFDAEVTGQVGQTSFGSVSLVKGTQYWYAFTRSASVSFNCKGVTSSVGWVGPTENLSSAWYIIWIPSGSDNALPSSVSSGTLGPRGYNRISVGLKF